MKKLLGLLLTVLLITVYASAIAAPPGTQSQVTVINTEADPVPVNVQNQPTVNINGIPTVRVFHDVEPLQRGGSCIISDYERQCGNEAVYVVPEGKRLVIEYFSCASFVNIYSGPNLQCLITTIVGGNLEKHFLPTSFPETSADSHFNSAGQLIKAYADPGTQVGILVRRGGITGNIDVDFSISGFLIDVQQ